MKWFALVIVLILLCVYRYVQYQKRQIQHEQKPEKMESNLPDVRVRVFEGQWDISKVRSRPNCLFVFGDNEDGVGHGGQAIIRDQPNAVGIPTKLRPYQSEDSFYSDEQIEDNKAAIDEAIVEIRKKLNLKNATGRKYNCLMFPESGLGTGRSQLPRRAPQTYEYMLSRIFELARDLDPAGSESTSPTAWGPWIKFLFENTQYQTSNKQRIGI